MREPYSFNHLDEDFRLQRYCSGVVFCVFGSAMKNGANVSLCHRIFDTCGGSVIRSLDNRSIMNNLSNNGLVMDLPPGAS